MYVFSNQDSLICRKQENMYRELALANVCIILKHVLNILVECSSSVKPCHIVPSLYSKLSMASDTDKAHESCSQPICHGRSR